MREIRPQLVAYGMMKDIIFDVYPKPSITKSFFICKFAAKSKC